MDVDDIKEAIGRGELDGNLDKIVEAAVERVRDGAVAMPWKITFDGDTWTEESVTIGELAFAEQLCWIEGTGGRRRPTRAELDPRVRSDHTLALVVAHLHKAQNVALRDAVKRAESITAAELEQIVGEYEVVRPPKDGSPEPTT